MMMMMMMMMSSSSSHCITQVGVASPLPRTRKNTRSLRFCFESWFCPKAKRKRHDDDDDDDTKSSSFMWKKAKALLSTRRHFSMRSLSTQSDTMTTMNPESNVSLDVASFPAVRVKLSIDLLLGFKILNTIVLLLLLIGD